MMDTLYRFEFDEFETINSIVIRASSFTAAYYQASLIVGDRILECSLISISLIY